MLSEFKLILNESVNFYSPWMTMLKHQFRIKHLRKLLKSCLFRARQYFVCRAYIYNVCIQKARSSHWRCSLKKVALKNFTVFTGKHMCFFFKLCFMAEFARTHCVKSRSSLSRFYEVHANSVLDHNFCSNMFKVFWKIYFFNVFTKFTGRNKGLRPF